VRQEIESTGPRRWSTESVEPGRALAYWVDTICDCFLELDIDTPLRPRFRARLEQVDFGPATVNFIEAEAQRVQRTRARISRSRYPVYFLMYLRKGDAYLHQLDRETALHAGQCVLIDGTEPYRLDCPQATDALALRLPDQWLRRWISYPERHRAHVFCDRGWDRALNAALASLDANSCTQLALPKRVVAEQIGALLALATGAESSGGAPPSLFEALQRTLRDRLEDPNLTPLDVARQHRISKRSLHYAFARAGTTFTEQLISQRLERARDILGDSRYGEVPISDIAAQCGFMDPSHFARRFRRQFGRTPQEFREATLRARH